MAQSKPPSLIKVALAFAAVYVIWGSTYLGIKFCLETIHTVFLMPGVRFVLAGSVLYAWACRGQARPTLVQWRDAAIIGGALLYIANGCVVWAQTRVPSGLTALIVAMVPVCMVLLDWLRRGGTRPGPKVIAGLILGLIGIGVLTGPDNLAGGKRVDPLGAAALVFGCFIWSAGSLYSRSGSKPRSPYLAAAMQMLAGGALHLTTGTLAGEWSKVDVSAISFKSYLALAYLMVFGSIVAFTAYMWLMQVSTPAKVSTYAYVNPLVAVFLGWGWGNEPLNPRTFLATAIIVTAVVFITSQQGIRAAAAPPKPGFSVVAGKNEQESTPDLACSGIAKPCAASSDC